MYKINLYDLHDVHFSQLQSTDFIFIKFAKLSNPKAAKTI
jgi:hypothetical protein